MTVKTKTHTSTTTSQPSGTNTTTNDTSSTNQTTTTSNTTNSTSVESFYTTVEEDVIKDWLFYEYEASSVEYYYYKDCVVKDM
jgi:hypothetical protein